MEIGEKHNLLTAIRFVERKNWRPYWLFKCECGGDKVASASNVLYGNIKSCGCLKRSQEIDITGKKYGLLTAIKKHGSKRDSKGQPFWTFTCECGNSKDIIKHAVTSGKSKSCGCQKSVASGKDHWAFKGGDRNMKTNKLYRAYRSILQRCNNVDSDGYFRYGGRGIKVLWESFEDFKMDMEESYHAHMEEFGARNTSIDRIDVNGNYSKENCRWATQKEQARNTRKNKFYTLDTGEVKIQTDLTVNERRRAIGGWDKEDIIHGKKLPNTGDMRKQERNFKEEKKVMMDRFKLSSQVVYTYLSVLDDRERNIIEKRFGLNTGKRATLQEIADEQNVTRERVRQIEYKAIEKMVRFYSDITY